jgi:hypothetical protein
VPRRRGALRGAPRLDSSDRRKRARSFVYLAASRLQLAADVPPTMRRTDDAGKYCHACGVPPGSGPPRRAPRRFSGFPPFRSGHGNAIKHNRAPCREKLGFSLPAWTLSAIFRGARVRNIKKYVEPVGLRGAVARADLSPTDSLVRGFRTSHGRDPIAIAGFGDSPWVRNWPS